MSETAMQFGPEWLRALSGDASSTSVISPPGYGAGHATMMANKIKMARHRYTREELVSIFDEDAEPPDVAKLRALEIYVEEPQAPIVLKFHEEEDIRLNDAVRGPPAWGSHSEGKFGNQLEKGRGGGRFDRQPEEVGRIATGAGPPSRGRSIALPDRGMRGGRGRGSGANFYPRGASYDDEGAENLDRRDFRGRGERIAGFDRERDGDGLAGAGRGERKFERTFSRDEPPAAPPGTRKEPSRSNAVENWRNAPRENDRDGWRSVRGEEWNNRRRPEWRGDEQERGGGTGQDAHDDYHRNGRGGGRYHDDRRESLPEWSLDDAGPAFGTFDASGAFCETDLTADDELEPRRRSSKDEREENRDSGTKRNGGERSFGDADRYSASDDRHKSQASDPSSKNQQVNSDLKQSDELQDDQFHLEKTAVSLVDQWDDEEKQRQEQTFKGNNGSSDQPSKSQDQSRGPIAPGSGHVRIVHGQVVRALPPTHADAYKWLYLDPQQDTQGPFTSKEMVEWFKAGYFTPDLLVRRGCDDCFIQLGKLMRFFNGSIPFFIPAPQQPPPIISEPQNTGPSPVGGTVSSGASLPSSSSDGPIAAQSRAERAPLMRVPQEHNKPHSQPMNEAAPAAQDQTINPLQSMMARLQQQQQQQQQQHAQLPQQVGSSADMQNQLRQVLAYLKKQDGFNRLTEPQQKTVLLQMQAKLMSHQQEQQRGAVPSSLNNISNENLNPAVAQLFTSRQSPVNSTVPVQIPTSNPTSNTWRADSNSQPALYASDLEVLHRKEQETRERLDHDERQRRIAQQKSFDEEARKRLEMDDLIRKRQEEDLRHLEEMRRKNEEAEKLRREMIRQKEEEELRRRQTEERLRRETDERMRREAEEAAALEQERQRRIEEGRRMLQEQKTRDEEQRRLIEEMRRAKVAELERARQDQLRRQMEEQERIRAQQQQHMDTLRKMSEQQQKATGNPWVAEGQQREASNAEQLSLSDIQKAQEEKEREERLRREQFQQQQMDAILRQQKQQQQPDQHTLQQLKQQHLSWANAQQQQQAARTKTLAEIQKEEADKVAREMAQADQKRQKTANVPNAGIWSNAASHLQWKREQEQAAAAAKAWGGTSAQPAASSSPLAARGKVTSPVAMGFWDEQPPQQQQPPAGQGTTRTKVAAQQQPPTSLQSISSALSHTESNSSKVDQSKPNRAKKDEDSVMKLFETQRRQPTDEFTQWCMKSLKSYESTLDVATFVAFLKDVESPYDITDYVRQYLPDGKETREFVKQFVEKRSYYRNRAKQNSNEELTGPAKAVIPSSIKANSALLNSGQAEGADASSSSTSGAAQKAKKKKNKVKQRLDSSILGFTVQADPDRVQGELETLED